jgi:WhiB family transcriptional regulator, redox-sensing transcriptional regulator
MTSWGTIVDSENWHVSALCRQVDPDTFYPAKGRSVGPARVVCRGCPVKVPCLRDGLQLPTDDIYGIRAGLAAGVRRLFNSRTRHAKVGMLVYAHWLDDEIAELLGCSVQEVREIRCEGRFQRARVPSSVVAGDE